MGGQQQKKIENLFLGLQQGTADSQESNRRMNQHSAVVSSSRLIIVLA